MQTTEESACVFTVSMTGIRWWSSAPALHFQEVEQKYVEPASSSESTSSLQGALWESPDTLGPVQFPHGRTLAPQVFTLLQQHVTGCVTWTQRPLLTGCVRWTEHSQDLNITGSDSFHIPRSGSDQNHEKSWSTRPKSTGIIHWDIYTSMGWIPVEVCADVHVPRGWTNSKC